MRALVPLRALLALLLAAPGGAAPLLPDGSSALTKLYPRGSHWAVELPADTWTIKPVLVLVDLVVPPGHLMGKKSTGDFPYVYEDENKTPFSALPENSKQPEEDQPWEEVSKHLLRLLEGDEKKNAHLLKGGLPWFARSTWETEDNSSWKDMMDYLLQVENMKESAPS